MKKFITYFIIPLLSFVSGVAAASLFFTAKDAYDAYFEDESDDCENCDYFYDCENCGRED